MNEYNGGSAFPYSRKVFINRDGEKGYLETITTEGMTLRDYFAGQALSGMCARRQVINNEELALLVKSAYEIAGKMIEEKTESV